MRRLGFWAGIGLGLVGLSLVYLPVGDFYLFLVSKAAAWLLLVAGLNIALGYTGLFSFAHVAMYALGAYATAVTVTTYDLPVGIGFLLAIAVGAVAGAVLSLSTLRAKAVNFAVVSLVVLFAVAEFLAGSSLTEGEVGIRVRRPVIGGEELLSRRYWLFTLIVAAACLFAVRNLIRSPIGRAFVAVRESEAAAGSVGIHTFGYRAISLAFGGAVAAVGGALFAHLDGFVSPELTSFEDATLFVAALLVGGAGTLWGPILGVAIFIGIDRGLVAAQDALPGLDLIVYRALIAGVILFLVIVFLPRGVAGAVRDRLHRRRAAGATPREEAPAAAAVLPAPRRPAPKGPALEVAGLTKAFGGLLAVDSLDLVVERGTIHGLIGPNGSGKTTSVNLITGALAADAGTVRFLGEALDRRSPHRMARLGLGRVFQHGEVFESIPAEENVMVGFHLVAERNLVFNVLRLPHARRGDADLRRAAGFLLQAVGLGGRGEMTASALPHGDRRLLEVARALAARPTLLILDEPATGLSAGELTRLTGLLRRLADAGVTVLLIEHNMEFLMGLCDRVTVLDYGRKIAEGSPAEVQADPRVVEAYLGEEAG